MDEARKFYVYAYLRKKDGKNGAAGTPYYIGKGHDYRAYEKHSIKVPKDKSRITFIAENMTEADAFQAEMLLIHLHGRTNLRTGCLRNRTDGGEGVSGLVHTEDTRRRIGKAHKGRVKSESERLNISEGQKKRNPPTAETRRKMSEAATGRKLSEATRLKVSEFQKGRTRSEETRRRMSEARKGRPGRKLSEEERRHLSAITRGRKLAPRSPEHCHNIREAWARRRAAKAWAAA